MRIAVALMALFLSGFSGLLYEVCWLRQAALAFGSTTFAMGTVLAVFFLGIALGSYTFGRIAERTSRPLRLFALLEVGLGAFALCSPHAFDAADSLYGTVYRAAGDRFVLLMTARVFLISAVLLPPTFLMGGTLPLFCRQYVIRASGIGASIGGLYGLNTLGAAAGCATAGLLLLPSLGLSNTIGVGAALNIVGGLVVASLRIDPLPPAPDVGSELDRAAVRRRTIVSSLFFLTGLVALGSEVLWTRFLALLVGNTVHTTTLILTVVLLGIVLGSLLAVSWVDRSESRGVLFGLLQIATGISVLALMLLPADLWRGFQDGIAVYALLLLPPAILSGASLPLAMRLVVDDAARAGSGVGRLLAINTLGGIVGSLGTAFLALPLLGLQATLLLLTGLSLAGGITAWLLLATGTPRALRGVAVAGTVAIWLFLPSMAGTRLPADFLTDPGDLLVDYREGRGSNLAVIRNEGTLHLEIDRWWQGQDRRNHQAVAAHVPMLLHPDPRSVLVVGAGTGQTPSRFLMYDVDRLDCMDIEPAVFDVIRDHFDSAWMLDPRVSLLHADGRDHLAHSAARYDVISLELGQVFRPGAALLYTADFYQRARKRLEPDGLLVQFVPLSFLTVDQFRGVVRSFQRAFPQSLLWYNTSELLLIGINGERLELAHARLELLSADPRIHLDLSYSHWGGPDLRLHRPTVFLASFLVGPDGLATLAAGAPLYRDDHPVLDYATYRVEATQTNEIPIARELREHLEPVAELLDGSVSAVDAAAIREIREQNLADIAASALARKAEVLIRSGEKAHGVELLAEALARNPGNFAAQRTMAEVHMQEGRPEEARAHFAEAVRIREDDVQARRGLATALHRLGHLSEAIRDYRVALALRPDDAEAHNNLGAALAQRGDLRRALEHFETALSLQPDYADARRNVKRARMALRDSGP
jgi:spermidine synthase